MSGSVGEGGHRPMNENATVNNLQEVGGTPFDRT